MSASVSSCGHTLHGYLAMVSDVLITQDAPQVHTHVLTDAEDYALVGHRRIELCCHGCGQSVLVLHDDGDTKKVTDERDLFLAVHKKCPDLGFDSWCPDVRTSSFMVDLRKKTALKRAQETACLTPHLGGGKTRSSSKEDGA